MDEHSLNSISPLLPFLLNMLIMWMTSPRLCVCVCAMKQQWLHQKYTFVYCSIQKTMTDSLPLELGTNTGRQAERGQDLALGWADLGPHPERLWPCPESASLTALGSRWQLLSQWRSSAQRSGQNLPTSFLPAPFAKPGQSPLTTTPTPDWCSLLIGCGGGACEDYSNMSSKRFFTCSHSKLNWIL